MPAPNHRVQPTQVLVALAQLPEPIQRRIESRIELRGWLKSSLYRLAHPRPPLWRTRAVFFLLRDLPKRVGQKLLLPRPVRARPTPPNVALEVNCSAR